MQQKNGKSKDLPILKLPIKLSGTSGYGLIQSIKVCRNETTLVYLFNGITFQISVATITR